MQLVHCSSGGSFLVGDDLAAAVLDYAWALAQYRATDVVRLPVTRPDGSPGTAALLLGPTSRLSVESTDDPAGGVLAAAQDGPLAAELHGRASRLRAVDLPFAGSDDFDSAA